MTTTLKLRCPCGSMMSVAAKFVGKRAACKNCGKKFTIPDRKNPSNTSQENLALVSAATKKFEPKSKTEHPCPSCQKNMGQGTVVCIACGYHTKLNRKLKSLEPKMVSEGRGFQFTKNATSIVLYFIALAFVVAVSLWARTIEGPTFLTFFFASFCVLGVLTVLGRKFWCDTDVFHYASAAMLAGIGLIRIVDSVVEGRFKFMFLIIGMIVSVGIFLISTTEKEKQATSPFVDDRMGLAALPFVALFVFCVALLASIFYIPAVGDVVVRMGFLVILMFGALFGLPWAALNFEDFGKGTGGMGSSSCNSCGSSCGGGCGGGCGGCGG